MKKKPLRIVVPLLLLAAIILDAPLPKKLEAELPGVHETASGDTSPVTVSLDAWIFRYLVREDRIKGELTVAHGIEGEGSSATYTFTHLSYPENDKGVFYDSVLFRRVPSTHAPEWAAVSLSKDLDYLLIQYGLDAAVAAGPENDVSAEKVWNYFEFYGSPFSME